MSALHPKPPIWAGSSPRDPTVSNIKLKANVKRTVLVEEREGRPMALVKVFHAPGISRLRDGRRARSEAEALRTARSCDLPVPIVEHVRHEGGCWTLRLQWIDGARPLEDVLQEAPGTVRRAAIARRLGELIATAERVGLRHPDPHPANVLVDASGKLWLVERARARVGGADPVRFERMLTLACARVREITTPGFRGLVYRAFLRAHRIATETPSVAALEAGARSVQRRDVERRVEVWCRDSSATRVLRNEEGQRVVRVIEAGHEPAPGWRRVRIESSSEGALAIWSTAVRATLHRLPTVRPTALATTPPCFVEVDVPDVAAAAVDPARLVALHALLADRGLAVEGDLLADADGAVFIGVGARLVHLPEPAG